MDQSSRYWRVNPPIRAEYSHQGRQAVVFVTQISVEGLFLRSVNDLAVDEALTLVVHAEPPDDSTSFRVRVIAREQGGTRVGMLADQFKAETTIARILAQRVQPELEAAVAGPRCTAGLTAELADLYVAQGRIDDAFACVRSAVARFPRDLRNRETMAALWLAHTQDLGLLDELEMALLQGLSLSSHPNEALKTAREQTVKLRAHLQEEDARARQAAEHARIAAVSARLTDEWQERERGLRRTLDKQTQDLYKRERAIEAREAHATESERDRVEREAAIGARQASLEEREALASNKEIAVVDHTLQLQAHEKDLSLRDAKLRHDADELAQVRADIGIQTQRLADEHTFIRKLSAELAEAQTTLKKKQAETAAAALKIQDERATLAQTLADAESRAQEIEARHAELRELEDGIAASVHLQVSERVAQRDARDRDLQHLQAQLNQQSEDTRALENSLQTRLAECRAQEAGFAQREHALEQRQATLANEASQLRAERADIDAQRDGQDAEQTARIQHAQALALREIAVREQDEALRQQGEDVAKTRTALANEWSSLETERSVLAVLRKQVIQERNVLTMRTEQHVQQERAHSEHVKITQAQLDASRAALITLERNAAAAQADARHRVQVADDRETELRALQVSTEAREKNLSENQDRGAAMLLAAQKQAHELGEEKRDMAAQREALRKTKNELTQDNVALETQRTAFETQRAAFEAERAAFETQRSAVETDLAAFEAAKSARPVTVPPDAQKSFAADRAQFQYDRNVWHEERLEYGAQLSTLEAKMTQAIADIEALNGRLQREQRAAENATHARLQVEETNRVLSERTNFIRRYAWLGVPLAFVLVALGFGVARLSHTTAGSAPTAPWTASHIDIPAPPPPPPPPTSPPPVKVAKKSAGNAPSKGKSAPSKKASGSDIDNLFDKAFE